jgi:4-hydroxy-2-oxoheptanedioate aldolase
MQSANRILTNLRNGSKSFGAWQMLPGSNHSRAIASCKGLDWILVDTEHGNIDGQFSSSRDSRLNTCSVEGIDGAMHEAVAAIAACGVSPLVRIAANEGWMVKRMIL